VCGRLPCDTEINSDASGERQIVRMSLLFSKGKVHEELLTIKVSVGE